MSGEPVILDFNAVVAHVLFCTVSAFPSCNIEKEIGVSRRYLYIVGYIFGLVCLACALDCPVSKPVQKVLRRLVFLDCESQDGIVPGQIALVVCAECHCHPFSGPHPVECYVHRSLVGLSGIEFRLILDILIDVAIVPCLEILLCHHVEPISFLVHALHGDYVNVGEETAVVRNHVLRMFQCPVGVYPEC